MPQAGEHEHGTRTPPAGESADLRRALARSQRQVAEFLQRARLAEERLSLVEASDGYRWIQRLKRLRDRLAWVSATHEIRARLGSAIEGVLCWTWRLVLPRRLQPALDARRQDPALRHRRLRVFAPDPGPWKVVGLATVDTRHAGLHDALVSVIATVPDPDDTLRTWLPSLADQSRRPDEILLVNRGTGEGPAPDIRKLAESLPCPVRWLARPGAGAAEALNHALREATCPVVVPADTNDRPDPAWLEHLSAPFQQDPLIDAVMGQVQPDPEPTLADYPDRRMPSCRALAVRKDVALRTGGWQEHLPAGSAADLFALTLSGMNLHWGYAPEAVVHRAGPADVTRQREARRHHAAGWGQAHLFPGTIGRSARAILTLTVLAVLTVGLAVGGAFLSPLWWAAAGAAMIGIVYVWRCEVTQHPKSFRVPDSGRTPSTARETWRHAWSMCCGGLRGMWRSRDLIWGRVLDPDAPTIVFPRAAEWFWMKQRPGHLAEGFAEAGMQVVFCPNGYAEQYYGNLIKVHPRIVLCMDMALLGRLTRPIYWCGAAHHFTRGEVRIPRRAQAVFDLLDDNAYSGSGDADVRAAAARAELTCVTSRKLQTYLKDMGVDDALLVPNAVRYEDWRPAERDVPDDLADWVGDGDPVIGYFGALSAWFDFEMVAAAATARPGYRFVLIGPALTEEALVAIAAMPPNVRHLGLKHYSELPAYLEHFTVATIPFLVNAITLSTSPVKLYEYAAAERPIVTTDLPECRAHEPVRVAEDRDAFVTRLDEAVAAAGEPEACRALREMALANTWSRRVEAVMTRLGLPGAGATEAGQT